MEQRKEGKERIPWDVKTWKEPGFHGILFLFHRKDLVTLMYKSKMAEGLSHETKSTSCLISHYGGKEDVAVATRRRRRILQRRILFNYGDKPVWFLPEIVCYLDRGNRFCVYLTQCMDTFTYAAYRKCAGTPVCCEGEQKL